jgi:hypothetical protein
VGDFPVAAELRAFGFRWFPVDDPAELEAWLARPDPVLLDHNEKIAEEHFGIEALSRRLDRLLTGVPVCHHATTGEDGGPGCDCLTA